MQLKINEFICKGISIEINKNSFYTNFLFLIIEYCRAFIMLQLFYLFYLIYLFFLSLCALCL